MPPRLVAFTLAGILAGSAALSAGQQNTSSNSAGRQAAGRPSAGQQPLGSIPLFRAAVHLNLLDVVVRDQKTGRLVRGLTKDDFTVYDNGTPQTVASFAFVDLPRTRTTAAAPSPAAADDIATNEQPSGRVVLFLINDPTLIASGDVRLLGGSGRMTYLLDLLHRFVDRDTADDDQVAIWPVSEELPHQGFTTDRARLDAVIDRLGGYFNLAFNYGSAEPYQALFTLDTMVNVLARFGRQRKVIVWLGRFPDFMKESNPIDGDEVLAEFNRVLAEAAAANVAIYPVSVRGVTGNISLQLNILAAHTGGVVAHRNDFDRVLSRIEGDAGTYYLLGFTPSGVDRRPDKLHDVRVVVNRPGAVVLTRSQYVPFLRGSQAFALSPFATPVTDMAVMPLPDRGMPLRMQATCFEEQGKGNIVVATVRVGLPGARFSGHTVEYAVAAVDDHGRVTDSDTGASVVPKTGGTPAITIVSTLHVAPGMWTIRAAVKTDHRLAGSVFLNLDAPNLTQALALSDVALTSSARHVLVIGKPPAFLTRQLPTPPTTTRTFTTSDTLSLYGEVYAPARTSAVSATLTVLGPRNAPERSIPLPLTARPADRGRSRFTYTSQLPLAGLAAGTHTLEITATGEGHSETKRVVVRIAGPRS